ncbi:LysR family transcriptional regulator [Streptomyces sp. S.PNR 29]|uniref:LysR family transcriptional regulator n=1 Tax=Streptomyces sp. S.PNR 29 TaxID=2973805 RepID=UPI0025B23C49|nr:LysR family transcriptional regulator [Streptomyces sp. S.PNR 29]MDN0200815.1 LysR family transcriptional regulator [Streptomyces sp. S.PNR 29]
MPGANDPAVHQLRSLLVLAEELHFGRAAARLFLTQPALSTQIRSLERRLGVRLFSRTSRKVELTALGRALLPLVRNVVEAADELGDAVRRSTAGDDGLVLRLGLTDCAASLAATRRVIAALTTLHPCLEVDFRVLDLAEQPSALAAGRIDAAFVYLPAPAGFHAEPLTTEPRVVCLSSRDPLARRPTLRLADLADRPMVGLAPEVSSVERRYWAADPRPDGTAVRYTDHRVTRVESLLSAVSFDEAIAFLPAVAAELFPRPDIHYRAVADLAPCTFAVAWPESARENSGVTVLADVCRRLRDQGGLPAGAMREADDLSTPSGTGCDTRAPAPLPCR